MLMAMTYEYNSDAEAAEATPQTAQQRKLRKAVMTQLKAAQVEEQRKEMLKRLLDSDAYNRIMNIRISNYDLYTQLTSLIVSLAQQGRLAGRMSDKQLLSILQRATARKEPTLEFKHK